MHILQDFSSTTTFLHITRLLLFLLTLPLLPPITTPRLLALPTPLNLLLILLVHYRISHSIIPTPSLSLLPMMMMHRRPIPNTNIPRRCAPLLICGWRQRRRWRGVQVEVLHVGWEVADGGVVDVDWRGGGVRRCEGDGWEEFWRKPRREGLWHKRCDRAVENLALLLGRGDVVGVLRTRMPGGRIGSEGARHVDVCGRRRP
jgi:hypothetical protein